MSVLNFRRGRRSVVAGLTLALGASIALLPATAAQAATPFIVIGTSDVSDSNLVYAVLEPRFEALYPQYDLQYVPKGTGAAITDARAGNGAAIIVHAASIENQFVNDGFSLEPAGRLVFWGDYVLAGPASDPAGVLTGAPTDIVSAFEKVAAAGLAGTADFVSRGGTPGTAVQERAIWQMTTGVPTCVVGASAGGGTRPKLASSSSTNCTNPDDLTADPDGAPFPAWYHTGNAGSQATNVNVANTCSFSSGNCYVFTDRGTLTYLQSQGLAQNLRIVTRNNSPAARGGTDALVNVFHAYGVNPAKFGTPIKTDAVAAKLFLDFMTSPATQTAMGDFLRNGTDQVFVPAAAPKLTAAFGQNVVGPKDPVKISGTLSNVVPGYPALNGVPVNLLEAGSPSPLSIPRVVGTTTTDASGNYSFNQVLAGGKNYRVGVGAIQKTEIASLTPPFFDLLTPTTTTVGSVAGVVLGKVRKKGKGRFTLKVELSPGAPASDPTKLTLFAAKKKGAFKKIEAADIGIGQSSYTFERKLKKGKWKFKVVYASNGFLSASSKTIKATLR